MEILTHEVPTRAYRSIERGKSHLPAAFRTGQELSAWIGAKREITSGEAVSANHLFRLYAANHGARELEQTGAYITRTSS
ncbi:hypothetical protein ACPXCP_41185, partial [Streptomyces sp. DT20]|uniref:hypothetical protein n=1 Tax=Streptomyces sp. DT20 TaxID=3416519 RepID=UPI003CECB73D